jgi:hypothetical protein
MKFAKTCTILRLFNTNTWNCLKTVEFLDLLEKPTEILSLFELFWAFFKLFELLWASFSFFLSVLNFFWAFLSFWVFWAFMSYLETFLIKFWAPMTPNCKKRTIKLDFFIIVNLWPLKTDNLATLLQKKNRYVSKVEFCAGCYLTIFGPQDPQSFPSSLHI